MFKGMSYVYRLIGKEKKGLILPIVLSIVDSFLNSFMYGVMLFLLLDLIDNSFSYSRLGIYFAVLLVIFVLRCIVQAISFTRAQCIGPDVTHRLRLELGNHLRSLNLGFLNKNSIGKITSILMTDINEFEAIITHCLCDFIKVISFTILSLIVAFMLSPLFGTILTVLVAASFPLLILSGRISEKNSVELRKANQNVISRIVEYVSGMKTFRLYNMAGTQFGHLDKSLKDLRKVSIKSEITILPFALSFSAITSFIVPVAIIVGIYTLSAGKIGAAQFLIILLLSVSISSILEVLSSIYPQLRSITKASENIISILDEKPLPYKEETVNFDNFDIEFSNVSFQYIKDRPILKNVSFKAGQGKTIALIGPSGSGKTTIASLLARFWDVDEGIISIGNHNIKDIKPDCLMENIAVVFQDVYLLKDTVYNNIHIGNPKASKQEVLAAAKAANCHEFISKMENGYETLVGEGGMTLSGGERQRISIARALLKDAPIVLLDETTSNLDADNEYEIEMAFNKLMSKKTVLVIAHRLETIENADNIIVLKDGEIYEAGTHKELLKQNGWYAGVHKEQCEAKDWKATV